MARTELISQLLLDPDTLRRIEDWVLNREEMNQASVAATMAIDAFLETLPSYEFKMMMSDLDINIPSSPPLMVDGYSSRHKNRDGLASDHRNVPTELNEDNLANQTACGYDTIKKAPITSTWEIDQPPNAKRTTLAKDEDSNEREQKKVLENVCKEKICLPPACNSTDELVNEGKDAHVNSNHSNLESADRAPGSSQRSREAVKTHVDDEAMSDDIRPVPHAIIYEDDRIHDHNVPQASGSPSNPPEDYGNSIGKLQSSSLQHHTQLPSETLNTLVRMLERELSRRNQPKRCDSCANFKAEIQSLKKHNRCLGQRIEELNWQFVLLQEIIEALEQNVCQKNQDIAENLRVIHSFHETMVKRKREISRLENEIQILRNKSEEKRNKEVFEVAAKEVEEYSQLCVKIKEQKEMIESVQEIVVAEREEKQVLKENLKQKSDESEDLLKENTLWREKENILEAKVKGLEAQVKDLQEKNRTLEAEKKKDTQLNQEVQEEFALREAELNERINNEIQQLMQVYKDLKTFAERHKLLFGRTSLNSENENG